MELEREIALLKEKLAVLEKIKELTEWIQKAETAKPVDRYVPYPAYPCSPSVWPTPWPTTTWGDGLGHAT